MDETCHCGSPMRGSDHCPWCGCEEHESWCDDRWDGVSRSWAEREEQS
jgi:hypothetical protein